MHRLFLFLFSPSILCGAHSASGKEKQKSCIFLLCNFPKIQLFHSISTFTSLFLSHFHFTFFQTVQSDCWLSCTQRQPPFPLCKLRPDNQNDVQELVGCYVHADNALQKRMTGYNRISISFNHNAGMCGGCRYRRPPHCRRRRAFSIAFDQLAICLNRLLQSEKEKYTTHTRFIEPKPVILCKYFV